MKRLLLALVVVLAFGSAALAKQPQQQQPSVIYASSGADDTGNFYHRQKNGLFVDDYGVVYQPVKGGLINTQTGAFIPIVK